MRATFWGRRARRAILVMVMAVALASSAAAGKSRKGAGPGRREPKLPDKLPALVVAPSANAAIS